MSLNRFLCVSMGSAAVVEKYTDEFFTNKATMELSTRSQLQVSAPADASFRNMTVSDLFHPGPLKQLWERQMHPEQLKRMQSARGQASSVPPRQHISVPLSLLFSSLSHSLSLSRSLYPSSNHVTLFSLPTQNQRIRLFY